MSDYNIDRKETELTGIIGREKMDVLADVVGVEKWKNYRDIYNRAQNLEDMDYPVQVDFELNGSCNLRCPMCPMGIEDYRKDRNKRMEFHIFKHLVDDGIEKGLKAINLSYVNEPMIRKDLPKFVKYAMDAGIVDTYFSSNATIVRESMIRELIEAGLCRVQFSIDATTQETYDKIRVGGKYEKVLENIDKFIKIRKEMNSITPLIRVNFVRTNINEHELEDFIEFWKDKVEMIGIQEMVNPFPDNSDVHSKTTEDKKGHFRCAAPFKEIVVTHKGDVLPCCTFLAEEMPLGNIKDNTIQELYNGEKMRELKSIHLKGEYWRNKHCKQCIEGFSGA